MYAIKLILITLMVIIFISVLIALIYTISSHIISNKQKEKEMVKSFLSNIEESRQKNYQENSIFLSGGKYIGDRDIPIGIYDVFAVSGYGKISTKNPNIHKNFAKKRNYNSYKNLEILKDTSLEVDLQLRIKLYNKRELLNQKTNYIRLEQSMESIDSNINKKIVDISSFEDMDGWQFENFCASMLKKIGYENVEVTKGSGDQGVDILAERDGVKYAVQCKKYSQPVGNSAIQQIYSGMKFYHCHVGVVMTNNYFTKSAKELAKENGIILWDRDFLYKYISNSVEDKIEKSID